METFWIFRLRFRRAYDSQITTPILDFHWVISSLVTPTTPTPPASLVKTSLQRNRAAKAFTRLLHARSLCSLPLSRVTQRWARSQASLNKARTDSMDGLIGFKNTRLKLRFEWEQGDRFYNILVLTNQVSSQCLHQVFLLCTKNFTSIWLTESDSWVGVNQLSNKPALTSI